MCKYPVEGVVIGMAGSAACDILQVCTRRKATKHSSLFNHAHLGASVYSHERTSRKEFEEAHARVHAVRVSIWRERLNKTEEEISEKILDKDRTISAEQALAEGWIDEVI